MKTILKLTPVIGAVALLAALLLVGLSKWVLALLGQGSHHRVRGTIHVTFTPIVRFC